MSEAAEEIQEALDDLAQVARAIGAASSNPDWRFAAKHWGKVNDEKSTEELTHLAAAVLLVKPPPNPVYSGYSRYLQLGDWFGNRDNTFHGQVTAITNDGKNALLAWYYPGKYGNIVSHSLYVISDFIKSYKKLAPAPIK